MTPPTRSGRPRRTPGSSALSWNWSICASPRSTPAPTACTSTPGRTARRRGPAAAGRAARLAGHGGLHPRERAALALAEATTTPADTAVADEAYADAREVLTDDEISAVIWVAITINAFNRVSIMSKHPVRALPAQ